MAALSSRGINRDLSSSTPTPKATPRRGTTGRPSSLATTSDRIAARSGAKTAVRARSRASRASTRSSSTNGRATIRASRLTVSGRSKVPSNRASAVISVTSGTSGLSRRSSSPVLRRINSSPAAIARLSGLTVRSGPSPF